MTDRMPLTMERVTTRSGDVYLVEMARFHHVIDGKVLVGVVVNDKGERNGYEQVVIRADEITERMAMTWGDDHDWLVEAPEAQPFSDRAF